MRLSWSYSVTQMWGIIGGAPLAPDMQQKLRISIGLWAEPRDIASWIYEKAREKAPYPE